MARGAVVIPGRLRAPPGESGPTGRAASRSAISTGAGCRDTEANASRAAEPQYGGEALHRLAVIPGSRQLPRVHEGAPIEPCPAAAAGEEPVCLRADPRAAVVPHL